MKSNFSPVPVIAPNEVYIPTLTSSLATTPYPAYFTSFSLLASIIPSVRGNSKSYPLLVTLPLFSSLFLVPSHMIKSRDSLNGSGTATAWAGIFLFFNAKKAIQSKTIGPKLLSGVVATMGTIYGWHYFQQ